MLEEVSRAAGATPLAALFISTRPEGKRGGWQQSMTINFTALEADQTKAPEDLLQVAERNLERAALRLSAVIDEVEAGRVETVSEVKKTADNLMGFVRLLMEERNKVDKLRKSVAGAVGAGALDFAAARDEIGRRLALLRDAGGD